MRRRLVSYFFLTIFFLSVALPAPHHVSAENIEINYISFEFPEYKKPPGSEYFVEVTAFRKLEGIFVPQVMEDPYNPYAGWPKCQNCPIKIKLENPQENDSITQNSEETDDNGRVSAKVISKIYGPRLIYAQVVMPDKMLYASRRYVLNYYEEHEMIATSAPVPVVTTTPIIITGVPKPIVTSMPPQPQPPVTSFPPFRKPPVPPITGIAMTPMPPQPPVTSCPPFSFPRNNLVLKIIDQTPLEGPKGLMQNVTLDWNCGAGENVVYKIYARQSRDAKPHDPRWESSPEILGPPTSIILHNEYNWYIRVEACAKSYPPSIVGACFSSPSVFLPKHSVFIAPSPEPNQPITKAPLLPIDEEDRGVEKLQQRLDTLQEQLEESKQRQSVLEKTLNTLLNWLKSLFPFFPIGQTP